MADYESLKTGAFSREEHEKIKTMLEQNISFAFIAKELNRSYDSIKCHVAKHGGKTDYTIPQEEVGNENRRKAVTEYHRNLLYQNEPYQTKSLRLSDDDRREIEKLIKLKFNNTEIGRHLNRSKNTIRTELAKFKGSRIEYSAEKAIADAKERQEQRKRKLSLAYANSRVLTRRSPQLNWRDKVDMEIKAIQMQLNIVSEMLNIK
jgi:IS30 family transposase